MEFAPLTNDRRIAGLCWAISTGETRRVYLLLCQLKGINLNQCSNVKEMATPLYLAARSGNREAVDMLLACGADPNLCSLNGKTPLCIASEYGYADVVSVLLAHPAIDVNFEDEKGRFPLYYAAQNSCVDIVKLLMAKKADVTKTVNGVTARHAVEKNLLKTNFLTSTLSELLAILPKGSETPETDCQHELIKCAEGLGHTGVSDGICHGIGLMAVQALMMDERDGKGQLVELAQFDARVKRIKNISAERLVKNIEEVRKKWVTLLAKIKVSVALMGEAEVDAELFRLQQNSLKYTCDLTSEQKKKLLIRKLVIAQLTEKERLDLEIAAFFDGVVLYQKQAKYPDVFECEYRNLTTQIPQPVIRLVMPNNLKHIGGMTSILRDSCVFNPDELLTYFSRLRDNFIQSSGLSFPVALTISSPRHTITIGYDTKNDEWLFIDANDLPVKVCFDVFHLVQEIMFSLLKKDAATQQLALSVEMFIAAKHYQDLKSSKVLERWTSDMAWKKMHKITYEKLKVVDDDQSSWRIAALRMGQVSVVRVIDNMLKSYLSICEDLFVEIGGLLPVPQYVDRVEEIKKMDLHSEKCIQELRLAEEMEAKRMGVSSSRQGLFSVPAGAASMVELNPCNRIICK